MKVAHSLTPARPARATGRGHRFEDGFSPEFLILRATLHAYTDISRLLWRHAHRSGKAYHDTQLRLILQRWTKTRDTHPEAHDHLHRGLFSSRYKIAEYRKEHIIDKIGALKKILHGRQRKRMRLAMSDHVREMETMLTTRKLAQLIQRLLPDYTDPLDFNQLRDASGEAYRTPEEADLAAFNTMQDWIGIPPALNSIAAALEASSAVWRTLLNGLFTPCSNPIPFEIQREIADASKAKPIRPEVIEELRSVMHMPFSFNEFEHCRRHLPVGKSPGPSGLTTTQMKNWSSETSKLVFDLSSIMWEHHHIPQ